MIKNLNHLKKQMKADVRIKIVDHCKPANIGQVRRITMVNGNCFYSVVDGDPGHESSVANGGKGIVCWWMQARFWSFQDGICSIYTSDSVRTKDKLIMSFRILTEEET